MKNITTNNKNNYYTIPKIELKIEKGIDGDSNAGNVLGFLRRISKLIHHAFLLSIPNHNDSPMHFQGASASLTNLHTQNPHQVHHPLPIGAESAAAPLHGAGPQCEEAGLAEAEGASGGKVRRGQGIAVEAQAQHCL